MFTNAFQHAKPDSSILKIAYVSNPAQEIIMLRIVMAVKTVVVIAMTLKQLN